MPHSTTSLAFEATDDFADFTFRNAVSLGGGPPGLYADGAVEVLPSGKIVVAGTPYLAGAGFLLDVCVERMLAATVPLKSTAVCGTNPMRARRFAWVISRTSTPSSST